MKKTVFILLFTVLFFLPNKSAYAQTSTPGAVSRVMQKFCTQVTTLIGERIAKWEENEPKKEAAYQKTVNELKVFIDVLTVTGYNTTELKKATEDLNNAIIKRHNDRKIYIEDLKKVEQYACGQSEGKFLEALKAARDQWKVVFADTLQIKNIWENEVRPAIKNLKNQKIPVTPGLTK